jgi:hypothetical protein
MHARFAISELSALRQKLLTGGPVRLALLGLAFLCVAPPATDAQERRRVMRDQSCLVLADQDTLDLLVTRDPAAAGSTVVVPDPPGPITADEVGLLIRDLQHVPLAAGGWTIRAVQDGGRLSPERMQTLVGDVRSVLAELHGRELLDVLRKVPGTRPEDVQIFEKLVKDIARCTVDRFGGENAHEQTLAIVKARRPELEAVVLEPLASPGPPK